MTAAPCVKNSHLENDVEPTLLISPEVFTQTGETFPSYHLSLSLTLALLGLLVLLIEVPCHISSLQ